ncbi:DUF5631 domain-containing protein [Mycobacterium sp. E1214]|uniref:DUF5631 domain-containing protein n=1 Tax=unclassified Mycobacterium TaxID=2642494 RepID=UPI003519C251
MASRKPPPEQLAEVQAVQARCNTDAANASRDAVNKLMAATQKILNAEGIAGDAQSWAIANGFDVGDPKPPKPIGQHDLHESPTGPRSGPANGGVGPNGQEQTPGGGSRTGGGGLPGHHPGGPSNQSQNPGGASWSGTEGSAPGVPAPAPPVVHMPGGGGGISPGMPGVPGGGTQLSPAGFGGQGLQPNLAQTFANGFSAGQATGPGGQAFSTGALNALEGQAPQAAPAVPGVTPTVPSAGAFIAGAPPVDAPPAAAPAPMTGGGSIAPVMSGASWSSSTPLSGSALSAGPLPAYGSDLRPPVVAPPSVPSVPSGPVSGAPVAPSPSSSPSAGGSLVSSVQRGGPGPVAGSGAAGSPTLVGASAASAAAGATAGAVSGRSAEQQRLQRLVDAVARQEPRLSWAAGLRDDGTTTLVTDLAGGWIPPHVRLPAHVTLLSPAVRRHDMTAVDLLGAVTVAAAHDANSYVVEPGSDEPVLSGDRLARSAAPDVDELGPTLVDAVRRRDGLPRIAQAIAAPAVRKTGVLDSEAQLLRQSVADIQQSVIAAYPDHGLAAAGDWMLLAAIEALIDGHTYLANYHLAWFNALVLRVTS